MCLICGICILYVFYMFVIWVFVWFFFTCGLYVCFIGFVICFNSPHPKWGSCFCWPPRRKEHRNLNSHLTAQLTLHCIAQDKNHIIKCTVCISQRGSREGAGKCRFYMASYYKEYSLHLPRRVQSRCWKMSALYGIVL